MGDTTWFLRPYGYLAYGPRVWEPMQEQVVLSICITNHAEDRKHTHYNVVCSLTWPADDGAYGLDTMQTWSVRRRLKHLRGLHDVVKRELTAGYAKLFRGARFAQRGGLKGTTSRLNAWFGRLAQIINSRHVPPQVVALALSALEAPDAPSDKPCKHCVQAIRALPPMAVCQLLEPTTLCRPASASTSVCMSEKDENDSDGWSDLGLSDADSLEDGCQRRETSPGTDDESSCLEVVQEPVEAVDRLPSMDNMDKLALAHMFSEEMPEIDGFRNGVQYADGDAHEDKAEPCADHEEAEPEVDESELDDDGHTRAHEQSPKVRVTGRG